ncbi:hypothetical protein Ndes2526B_g03426 [Nannochloris sp. 'desiccata']|nr:hypothetical protein KSW81_002033 [Chlorella desiccata (nom. nud.)]KAG7673158.1 hypothetical protein KSW81_006372 [Chlorella desiccata (nom. nud.)]KAH7622592.1 hypothetical protein NADE_005177 [Chlorella desiccata (nom. nud.)]
MAERRRTAHSKGATAPNTADIQVDTTQAPNNGPTNQPDWTAFADSLPAAVQPFAIMVIGIVRAAMPLFHAVWPVSKLMGRSGMYLFAMLSPLIWWLGSKWIQWYVMSYVKKAQRVLNWVVWLLNLLPKSTPA